MICDCGGKHYNLDCGFKSHNKSRETIIRKLGDLKMLINTLKIKEEQYKKEYELLKRSDDLICFECGGLYHTEDECPTLTSKHVENNLLPKNLLN